jgi:hypothetical protein
MNIIQMTSYVELALDSLQAKQSYNSGLTTLNWPKFDLGRQITNIVGFKVIETQIPFCWYVINNAISEVNGLPNNYLYTVAGVTDQVYLIPPGTYTAEQLATVLEDYYNSPAFSLPLTFPSGQVTTVTFDYTTLKFTIKFTANVPFAFATNIKIVLFGNTVIGNIKSVLGAALGLSGDNNFSNTAAMGESVLEIVSDKVANTLGPNYIYVNCATLGSQTNEIIPVGSPYFGGNGQPGPAIAKVPINCAFGGIIDWQDPMPEQVFPINISSLQYLDIFISSPWDIYKPLDFLGQSFSLKIVLICQDSNVTSQQAGTTGQGRVGIRNTPY